MKQMAIITQIWHIAKFYLWLMVPDHRTQYEENPSSHHGVMYGDRHPDVEMDCLMDGRTDALILSCVPYSA